MTLQEYQEQAMTTCMATSEKFSYMVFNLVGEVGGLCSILAEAIRNGQAEVSEDQLYALDGYDRPEEAQRRIDEMQKVVGDILWQLSGLCSVMGWNLEGIARQNLVKLASRRNRDVTDCCSDNR